MCYMLNVLNIKYKNVKSQMLNMLNIKYSKLCNVKKLIN